MAVAPAAACTGSPTCRLSASVQPRSAVSQGWLAVVWIVSSWAVSLAGWAAVEACFAMVVVAAAAGAVDDEEAFDALTRKVTSSRSVSWLM